MQFTTFERFLNDVQQIDERYNRHYLRAEYNFAHSSAQMAAKWEEFEKHGDRYLLQYRTANDGKVRPAHAALHNVTLEKSDPFWEEFLPPNGWNCRCTVVEVRRSKYVQTPHDEAMELGEEATRDDRRRMFRWNSGKTGKTFPDYNPYTIKQCRDCDFGKLGHVAQNELCAACKLLHECAVKKSNTFNHGPGKVIINEMVDPNDSDYEELERVARMFAQEGATVELVPKMTRANRFKYDCVYGDLRGTKYEGKCPDLRINDKWYELEGYRTSNYKRAFGNMLNHGLKQSSRIIIEEVPLTEAFMKRSIINRIYQGALIDEVWMKTNTGLILLYKKSEE